MGAPFFSVVSSAPLRPTGAGGRASAGAVEGELFRLSNGTGSLVVSCAWVFLDLRRLSIGPIKPSSKHQRADSTKLA